MVPKQIILCRKEYKTSQYGPILEATDKHRGKADEADGQYAGCKLITGDVKPNNLSGRFLSLRGLDVSGVRGDLLPDVPCANQRELRIINLFPLPVLDGVICCSRRLKA